MEKHGEITPDTNLVSDFTLDSFQVMEFMMELEESFDIMIDMNSLSNAHTVRDLAIIVAMSWNKGRITMALLDKFEAAAAIRDQLQGGGHDPTQVVIERIISPTEGIVEGRHTILAGTNNYLGLTFDPACVEAARKAVQEQGTGTTGSRMANGSFASHPRWNRNWLIFSA